MQIGIIGCGNMGSALVRGILSRGVFSFRNVSVCDKDRKKAANLYKTFGMDILQLNELVRKCEVIIIAVKPQDSKSLLPALADGLDDSKHLISLMAGVTIAKIESMLTKKVRITRAMPNMAAFVGRSITALSHNGLVKDKRIPHDIFSSVGSVIEVNESLMDAVTAVSGSGLAYFFYLTECLRDAAVKLGIKKEIASRLASETLTGSGALAHSAGIPPEVLRQRITSNKGTTEAALEVLMSKSFQALVENAVNAAAKRSKKLSQGRG